MNAFPSLGPTRLVLTRSLLEEVLRTLSGPSTPGVVLLERGSTPCRPQTVRWSFWPALADAALDYLYQSSR